MQCIGINISNAEENIKDKKKCCFFSVMLGSIPELPAETCKEIKASKGGQAVSGEYWFDSIIPGEAVLAHCDMKKEGKLKGKGEVRNLKTSFKSLGF